MNFQEKIEKVAMIEGIRLNDSNREKRNSERRPELIELMRQQLRTMHYAYRTKQN